MSAGARRHLPLLLARQLQQRCLCAGSAALFGNVQFISSVTLLGALGASSSSSRWQRPHELTRRGLTTTNTQNVQKLLDSMSAVKLRDNLEALASVRPFMTYTELLSFIKKQGAADTDDEAHARADALVSAGVVLRFNGVVYLRPQEVTALVYQTLPTDPAHARANLREVEAELATMEATHRKIKRHAQRWPNIWLTLGCGLLTLQLVGFTYLTFWELSWDVMEPIAYILSLVYSLLAYLYFLATRGAVLDYGPFKKYWTQKQLEKRMAEHGFDLARYEQLLLMRDRYRHYIAAADAPSHAAANGGSNGTGPGKKEA